MAPEPKWIVYGIPPDVETLAAIGKIALRHGQLDHTLRMAIKTLAGVTISDALDATARQGSRELRERIRKLSRKRLGEGPAVVQLDAILERARRATDKCNNTLHSLWAKELDGDPVIRTDDHDYVAIPNVSELEAVADELYDIAAELNHARLAGFLHEALTAAG
jgi:hypothetical protein